ncbi:MAG: metallophosphoesterase [Methanotrichaceae archaeon]|nr:metallophosphoesterase [Methanotrichaceae archaeon]
MTSIETTPLAGLPLLLVEGKTRVLVAADLHLGIEHDLWLGGASIPTQTGRILDRLLDAIDEARPDRLLLLGDIKHNVPRTSWQERREVPSFLDALAKRVSVDVVPGNHDGGISDLILPGTSLHPASGILLEGVAYFHGHTWPHPSLLRAEVLVAGHIHPAIRLTDALGCSTNRRAWIRAPLSIEALGDDFSRERPEMILVPAFNDLCGGLPLNSRQEEDRGPIPALANLDAGRIYLLDGTDLGDLRGIIACGRGGSRKRLNSRGR